MNTALPQQTSSLRCRKPVMIFSIVAVASLFVYALMCCTVIMFYKGELERLRFYVPHPLTIINILLYLAPSILLLVFAITAKGQRTVRVLIPILYGCIVIFDVFGIVRPVIYGYFHFDLYEIYYILSILLFSAALVTFIIGKGHCVVSTIACSLGILYELYNLSFLRYHIGNRSVYLSNIFATIAFVIGFISLYIAVMLMALTNKFPPLVKLGSFSPVYYGGYAPQPQAPYYPNYAPIPQTQPQASYAPPVQTGIYSGTPQTIEYTNYPENGSGMGGLPGQPQRSADEQALVALNNQYAAGMISNEEYRARMAQFLNRL